MAVDQPRAVVLHSLVMGEAATWIEALEMSEPPEEDFLQWLRWLDASDAHRDAWWRMFELWQLAAELGTAGECDT